MAKADASSHETFRIQEDLACIQCGYNLRTLRSSASCPECGEAIESTIGLGAIKHWPINAEWPCNWMCLGLLLAVPLGIGLLIWFIALLFFLRRMRTDSVFWTLVRHVSWISIVASIGAILCIILMGSYYGASTEGLLLIFLCATLAHFVCIFLLAIRLTTDARMPTARAFAYGCLALQAIIAGGFALGVPHSYMTASLGVVMCGLAWSYIGGMYWMGIAVGLGDQREAIERRVQRLKQQTNH
ncbi:MAG: hypothetical protein ACIAXF_05760 [Phycisphaerales bacterium JB063]